MKQVQTAIRTNEEPEPVTFVPRSVSWRSDILRDAKKIAADLANDKGAHANFSEFVNEAVKEKIERARQKTSTIPVNPVQEFIRKEIAACLLGQLQQR